MDLSQKRLSRSDHRATGTYYTQQLSLPNAIEVLILCKNSKREDITTPPRNQVYISEGCINCHTQYIRPNTRDVALYGPLQTFAELRAEHPPLIGNRRQGPDLTNVARRRSPAWLRAHLIAPASLSHNSIMPRYAYLFRSRQGDDLVAYLETLHSTLIPPGDPR